MSRVEKLLSLANQRLSGITVRWPVITILMDNEAKAQIDQLTGKLITWVFPQGKKAWVTDYPFLSIKNGTKVSSEKIEEEQGKTLDDWITKQLTNS